MRNILSITGGPRCAGLRGNQRRHSFRQGWRGWAWRLLWPRQSWQLRPPRRLRPLWPLWPLWLRPLRLLPYYGYYGSYDYPSYEYVAPSYSYPISTCSISTAPANMAATRVSGATATSPAGATSRASAVATLVVMGGDEPAFSPPLILIRARPLPPRGFANRLGACGCFLLTAAVAGAVAVAWALARLHDAAARMQGVRGMTGWSCQWAKAHLTGYWTTSGMLSEWLLNSGAYMHWIVAMPVWYSPLWTTRVAYSKTYVPLGR